MTFLPSPLMRRRASSLFPSWSAMDDWFNSWVERTEPASTPFFAGFPVDIEEGNNFYKIKADMPEVERKDIELSLDHKLLTIQVKRSKSEERKEGNYLLKERLDTSASRSVQLPFADETGKIDAALKDGVLTITVNKVPERQTRKVEIH